MKSKVLILWENEYYDDLCRTMEKLITEKDYYWFSVVCGGQVYQPHKAAGEQWAIDHGAQIEYLFEENLEILMRKLVQECDYLVMLLTDRTPPHHKQILMKMRGAGKHGTVIRK